MNVFESMVFFFGDPHWWPHTFFLVTPRGFWWTPKIEFLVTPDGFWWPPMVIGDPQILKKSKNQISIKFFSNYDGVSKTSLRCVFSISNIRLSIWYMYNRFFDFFQKCDLGRFLWPDSCDPKQYASRLKIVLSQKINARILKN